MSPGSPESSGPANSCEDLALPGSRASQTKRPPANRRPIQQGGITTSGRTSAWSAVSISPTSEVPTAQPSLDGFTMRPVSAALTAKCFSSRLSRARRAPSRLGMQALGMLWWARLGLNQRPLRCQRSALPLSYAPHASYLNPSRRHFNLVAAWAAAQTFDR
jgi:hypothetical protein